MSEIYSINNVLLKLQHLNINLKSVISPIKDFNKELDLPYIILIGETHSSDKNHPSYFENDFKLIESINSILKINNICIEGLAKGYENNVNSIILTGEIELIKLLSREKRYNLFGIEDYHIQISAGKITFLSIYSNIIQILQKIFPNTLTNLKFKNQIDNIIASVFQNSNSVNKNTNFNIDQELLNSFNLSLNEINHNLKELEKLYNLGIHYLSPLKYYPKNISEFNLIASNFINEYKLNPITDYTKIKLHSEKLITIMRDKIFAKNTLEIINENNLDKIILFCGLGHVENTSNLLREYCEKILKQKIVIFIGEVN